MLTDKQMLENVALFFLFFLAGVGFTKPTVFRVLPGKLRIGIWWVAGSVRTRARFDLSLILVLYTWYHTTESNPRHKSVQVQRLARVPGVVTVCSYPTEITL